MTPGWEGIARVVTARVLAGPVPQELTATTEIFPLALPVVTVIEVVFDVPVQPVGNVQTYKVAPLTGNIL